MSFKSREKKRRARAAQAAIARTRIEHTDVMKSRHYLTFVKRACSCNACGGSLRERSEMVFRFEPKEVLCVSCADSRGVRYRPSEVWERVRRARRRGAR